MITWDELVEAEPKLAELETEILAIAELDRLARESGQAVRAGSAVLIAPDCFCANSTFFGDAGWEGFDRRLDRLVGWDARNKALRTVEAYDTAFWHLYDLLPDCRNCGCA